MHLIPLLFPHPKHVPFSPLHPSLHVFAILLPAHPLACHAFTVTLPHATSHLASTPLSQLPHFASHDLWLNEPSFSTTMCYGTHHLPVPTDSITSFPRPSFSGRCTCSAPSFQCLFNTLSRCHFCRCLVGRPAAFVPPRPDGQAWQLNHRLPLPCMIHSAHSLCEGYCLFPRCRPPLPFSNVPQPSPAQPAHPSGLHSALSASTPGLSAPARLPGCPPAVCLDLHTFHACQQNASPLGYFFFAGGTLIAARLALPRPKLPFPPCLSAWQRLLGGTRAAVSHQLNVLKQTNHFANR